MGVATVTPAPQWVNTQQVPIVFGVSAKTVDRAIANGYPIQRRKFGTRNLYEVESINAWISSLAEE